MKRLFLILLVFCLAAGNAFAMEPEQAFAGTAIAQGEKIAVDLDGDGAQEQILLQIEGPDGEEELAMYVFTADGGVEKATMYVRTMEGAFAADLDRDGKMEIMVSADFYSNDYCTYAFQYDAESGLKQLEFKNVSRGEPEEGYYDYGYGMVTAVEGNKLSLTGSQDVLGTWMASRDFSLIDGRFETVDDGLWRMQDITDDAEIWEYYCLIPVREIAVKNNDGSEGKLAIGERFVISRSDRDSIAYFITREGREGSIEIAPDMEYGWGSLIEGVSENEWFEYVPYAD